MLRQNKVHSKKHKNNVKNDGHYDIISDNITYVVTNELRKLFVTVWKGTLNGYSVLRKGDIRQP
jgi:hypothetical protein